MATLAQFSKNIRKRGAQVANGGTRLTKAVSKRALRSLVTGTPADSGKARSNWRVGIGGVPTAVIAPYAPGKNLGIGETANASAAIAVGIARINSVSPGQGVRLGTSITIANNVPYIAKLNAGYSGQAPAMFVQKALAEARQEIANFRFFEGTGSDGN